MFEKVLLSLLLLIIVNPLMLCSTFAVRSGLLMCCIASTFHFI